jgi:hypothetical protein
VIDSLAVRPALIYAAPLMLDHVVLGWILGGFIADLVFYVFAIFSYERFKRLIAVSPSRGARRIRRGVGDGVSR